MFDSFLLGLKVGFFITFLKG